MWGLDDPYPHRGRKSVDQLREHVDTNLIVEISLYDILGRCRVFGVAKLAKAVR